MSFDKRKEFVEERDTIVLFLGQQTQMALLVDSKKIHQTKFGAFPHKDFIGKKYGTKVYSKNKKGWVYLLHPTPELWTVTLPHRTQILYSTDISIVLTELQLKPGSIVIESGTGSGSLSHAIIRAVKPSGHLHTFDFHQQRVAKAKEEFSSHGLGDYVTCKCADACADGFSLENHADAVFLDLPKPWEALPHAQKTLKKSGGRICSFSPCVEQVQRTCEVMRKLRFCEIKSVECLTRTLNVRTIPIPDANFGPDSLLKKEDLSPREEKRAKLEDEDTISPSEEKRPKLDADIDVKIDQSNVAANDVATTKSDVIESDVIESDVKSNAVTSKAITDVNISGVNARGMVTKFTARAKAGHTNVLTCKASKQMPGHTGYLTFASLYPAWDDSAV